MAAAPFVLAGDLGDFFAGDRVFLTVESALWAEGAAFLARLVFFLAVAAALAAAAFFGAAVAFFWLAFFRVVFAFAVAVVFLETAAPFFTVPARFLEAAVVFFLETARLGDFWVLFLAGAAVFFAETAVFLVFLADWDLVVDGYHPRSVTT